MAEATKTEKTGDKRKEPSVPAAGYTCSICGIEGHWIQQCTQKKKQKKKKKNPDHEFVAGVDPSPEDEERAREMQRMKPPDCYCGKPSRVKKVKQSRVQQDSRANGNYFFFCAERGDEPRCKYARPAEEELASLKMRAATKEVKDDVKKPKAIRMCTFFAKSGGCKKGDACTFSHDVADQPTKT